MIAETPLSERPRERLQRAGAASLSLRELLALLLGSGPRGKGCLGLADEILQRCGSWQEQESAERAFFSTLGAKAPLTLRDIKGLGDSGLARIEAALEIARRFASHVQSQYAHQHPVVQLSRLEQTALQAVSWEHRAALTEWFGFVPVYSSGAVGRFRLVAEGGLKQHVHVDMQELFAKVLSLRPAGFFIFHNHPSGHLTPSPDDLTLTSKIEGLCHDLGLTLLGHWIVAGNRQRLLECGVLKTL